MLRLELAEPVEIAAEVTHVDPQRKIVEVIFRGGTPEALERIELAIEDVLSRVRDDGEGDVAVGGDAHDRRLVVEQRDRPVLHLARGVGPRSGCS